MRNIFRFQWCWEFLKAFQQECQKSKCNRHHIGTSLHWSHIGWWVKADVICICYKDSTTGYYQCQIQVRNSWTFKDSNLMSPPKFYWSMRTATIVDRVTVVYLSKSIPKEDMKSLFIVFDITSMTNSTSQNEIQNIFYQHVHNTDLTCFTHFLHLKVIRWYSRNSRRTLSCCALH